MLTGRPVAVRVPSSPPGRIIIESRFLRIS
jgi:hypothetical protein